VDGIDTAVNGALILLQEDRTMFPTLMAEEIEESIDMGSFNHGYIQIRLGVVFERLGTYTAVSELNLDVSGLDLSQYEVRSKEEIKPDLSIYPKRGLSRPQDILRMREMPLLAIEIVSPKQGVYDLIEKFKIYFDLGVQSCWLVEPAINAITVYSSIYEWETYTRGDIVDQKLGIRLPIHDIFS
jgi:Uma2 family endonuclease